MKLIVAPGSAGSSSLRHLGAGAVCILMAAALLACTGGGDDSSSDERVLDLEARVHSHEESLEALAEDNDELKREVAILRRQQTDFVEAQEAAEPAREHGEAAGGAEAGQREQPADLEEGPSRIGERLDDLDVRLGEAEEVISALESVLRVMEQWSEGKDERLSQAEGSILERTVRLAEDAGGEVSSVGHPGRGDRSVLVMPRELVDGETPLIVSLHGYGGDSASHTTYVPLHELVNTHGFALLLPNGTPDGEGNRFWNPTDQCCDLGKSGEDDVAYLTELVASARTVRNFGPVYLFGYSNGGFMAYHMACKGLPGLRAVASLAGTSYVEDSSCEGAPPVSVLHIHGTADAVILYEGDETERNATGDGEPAFYAGARDMMMRWSRRAGCDWAEYPQPHATLDLDRYVPGPETHVFRLESGCADGITLEHWMGVGSSHSPAYGDTFVDALAGWLLSQE